ncbi:MAG: hypothetical protein HFK08_06355 [Clostridia bacterium]|jgi:hypothetical protein|nr:hypothetical protein [Clostridia bacterium]
MSFVKNYFKDRKVGFYLSFGAGAFAVIAAIVYLSVYMATKGQEIDRVFSVLNLVLMLVGGLGAIVLEHFRFKFGRLLPVICYSVAFAGHLVEAAYPLADALTGVAFLGGNLMLAIVFTVLFAVSVLPAVVSNFLE